MLWSYSLVAAAVAHPPLEEAENLTSALSQVEAHIYWSVYHLMLFKPWNKKLL